jgi:hypothetical protein
MGSVLEEHISQSLSSLKKRSVYKVRIIRVSQLSVHPLPFR